VTAIFVIAMLIVGANLLLGQNLTENDKGLLVLGIESERVIRRGRDRAGASSPR
jgi:hypothetical protein